MRQDTKSLVERLANDDLKENYALKVFPPILLLIMLSADELNPVKLCVPVTCCMGSMSRQDPMLHSPHCQAAHAAHLTASSATPAASPSTPVWRPKLVSGR